MGAVLIGFVLYPLLQKARDAQWCRFVGPSPHEYKVALRGGIPQSPSITSFAAVYGTFDEHEVEGLRSSSDGGEEADSGTGVAAARAAHPIANSAAEASV